VESSSWAAACLGRLGRVDLDEGVAHRVQSRQVGKLGPAPHDVARGVRATAAPEDSQAERQRVGRGRVAGEGADAELFGRRRVIARQGDLRAHADRRELEAALERLPE
jgi:hypothetical protein